MLLCSSMTASLRGKMGSAATPEVPPTAIEASPIRDVPIGLQPGPSDDEQVTLYGPAGLPWQDLALAWPIAEPSAASDGASLFDLLSGQTVRRKERVTLRLGRLGPVPIRRPRGKRQPYGGGGGGAFEDPVSAARRSRNSSREMSPRA
jgi:hypothetical protein